MFNGDFTVREGDLEDPIALARLQTEAKSILKSIQTEHQKLQASPNPTRSDLHYFRARFNYYRLSLLRLSVEEKSILEPALARFLHRIVAFEGEVGGVEPSLTPFLTPVEKAPMNALRDQTKEQVSKAASIPPGQALVGSSARVPAPSSMGAIYSPRVRSQNEELVSQLQLIKMALASEIDSQARKTLADGIERVIQALKS